MSRLGNLVNAAIRPHLVDALKLGGVMIADEILDQIKVVGPPRSKPGDPPHIDTRDLFRSIAWQLDPSGLRTVVVADTPYARKLEYGGLTGAPTRYQAPRPFMRRALVRFAASGRGPLAVVLSLRGQIPNVPTSRMRSDIL